MDRETARKEIKSRISCRDYLTKSRKGNYCCPFCGSGTGQHETGAVKFYANTNTWSCHSCRKWGDVIDLYMAENGVDHNEALSLMAHELGITIDPYTDRQQDKKQTQEVQKDNRKIFYH